MTAQAVKRGQESQVVVTRFAPSPTGRLHLGHAYSAIMAHDFARARNGRFLLRIEDIDGTRSRPEHVDTILADLAWLGLDHEPPVFQSRRLPLYAEALDRLRAAGLLYPCVCTRADLAAASASAPHGVEPVYPGTCRGLAAPDLSRPHCWRLDVDGAVKSLPARGDEGRSPQDGEGSDLERPTPLGPGFAPSRRTEVQPPHPGEELSWHDGHAGWVRADPIVQGDVILARKDAPASYHLAVTIDDAAQGVTDIVRGIDLFRATDIHRLLQALLGLPTPRYHHHRLLTGADGERLAKRHGSPTLAAMRAAGVNGTEVAESLRAGRLPTGFAAANP